MKLPPYAEVTIKQLESAGYEAYAVGGCVRDSLLGLVPHDWDICTNAYPGDIARVFRAQTVIPTGIDHGTVTVMAEGIPLEITTYRVEGDYRDHRHPETVQFVGSVEEDLSRRDFTVNAMAYHPDRGLVDPFGGKQDLAQNRLRCVGKASVRLEEDALRILRALRFAAVYGFEIESETKTALLTKAPLLSAVSAERVQAELRRLLCGDHLDYVLSELYPVLFAVIPELLPAQGFDQHSRYHCHDVLQHILKATSSAPPTLTVRLAALLHDIGKPHCFSQDENGNGHFYGHAAIGERMARDILTRLRFENKLVEDVCILIRYHDTPIEQTDRAVTRWLNKLSADGLQNLLKLKRADTMAHTVSLVDARLNEIRDIETRMHRLLEQRTCFSLHDLAVNGKDVLALGVPAGKAVGEYLQWALDEVMDKHIPNDKTALSDAIRKRLDYLNKRR